MVRTFRILTLAGLVALLTLAITSQFWSLAVEGPRGAVATAPIGLYLAHFSSIIDIGWKTSVVSQSATWNISQLVYLPRASNENGMAALLLPWWLLLAASAVLTGLIWRTTRRKPTPATPPNALPSTT